MARKARETVQVIGKTEIYGFAAIPQEQSIARREQVEKDFACMRGWK